LTLRIGNLLDESYAAINQVSSQAPIVLTGKTGKQLYWQMFTSLYGSYVFNDITLNGNIFSDSHSIGMVNEQAVFSVGLYVLYHHWAIAFSVHRGTEQFEGQEGVSKYGSLTFSYHY
jgi:lipid A 3-O-deacylase